MNLLILMKIFSSFLTLSIVNCDFDLTIVHNNDMHSRFLPRNAYEEDCEIENDIECYGGMAKIVTKINELRKQTKNLLFLNAGDSFAGTIWYNMFKWKLIADMVIRMDFDAMSFGNHEFDDGVEGLVPYLRKTYKHIPTLACNVDLTNQPRLRTFVKKSIVLNVNGHKVAIIGYVTPETADITPIGNAIKFTDEVDCIKNEVHKLRQKGINIFIALGHSGFEVDKKIAKQIPEIDIVVGGHTNTFLYNGPPPSTEKPEDKYPVVVKRSNGKISLVVQAYAYTKYLGLLNVVFNDNGDITYYNGQPIILDHTVREDSKIRQLLLQKSAKLKAKYEKVVGKTAVLLNGECRKEECNLGNLVTDIMIKAVLMKKGSTAREGWAEYPCAFISSGFTRSKIYENRKHGTVTLRDVIRVLPYTTKITGVTATGKILKEVFEHSVHKFKSDLTEYDAEFLQVSGFKITYDLSMPVGKRVLNTQVRCAKCRVPAYEDLNESKIYKVLTSAHTANGGDDYTMLKNLEHENFDIVIQQELINYFTSNSPALPGLEARSTLLNSFYTKSHLLNKKT